MKRLLLILSLLFTVNSVYAQLNCSGGNCPPYPNTVPTAGQTLVGNAGGTAYAVASVGGDATLASTGALTVTKLNGGTFPTSASVIGSNGSAQPIAATTTGSGTTVVLGTTPTFTTSIKTPAITPTADSTTAFQIFKADGATQVIDVDTTNTRFGVGTTPNVRLEVKQPDDTTRSFRITNNSGNAFDIGWSGSTQFDIAPSSGNNDNIRIGNILTGGSGIVAFYTGAAEKMRLDSSGNFEIGSSSAMTNQFNVGSSQQFQVTSAGIVTQYNNVAKAASENGVPFTIISTNQTAQGANINATNLVASATAGRYRASCYVAVTQQATTSSTVPNCNLICTDPTDSVAKTIQLTPAIVGVAANPGTGVGESDSGICDAKSATAIQYSTTGYASVGATPMQYKIYLTLEAL